MYYDNLFINETKKLYQYITDIKSSYKIKKYIHYEFIDLLNLINLDYNLVNYTFLDTISCIPKLMKKFKINNIDELENKISSMQVSINEIIDCSDLFQSIKDNNKRKILNNIYDNKFLPLKIIEWIEKCNLYFLLTWDNIKVHIINNSEINTEYINQIVLIIKWILNIANKQNINLDIFIYLSDIKKILPSMCLHKNNTCSLNSIHINSGVSWFTHWIQIFRKEELFKVLIHELIHYLKLDVNEYSNLLDSKCSHININYKSNKILINEAYTEMFAIYLHTLYVSKYIANKQNIDFKDIFWNLYIDEEKFTIYQINKIFQNYNISDLSFFKKSNNFIQYTNVISYYIIKYLFFINTKYFIKNYNNKKMLVKIICYLLEKFYSLKINKYTTINDFSLRMSLYQLNC